MKTIKLCIIVALVVLAILGSCKVDDEEDDSSSSSAPPPETAYVGYNNYAVIDGPAIGTNVSSNSNLRKGLTVTLVKKNPYLSISRSFATRGSESVTDSLYFHWILLVSNNTTNNAFCNIKVNTVSFKDSAGDHAPTTALSDNVYGSIGMVGSKYLKSCLSPGEVGYVLQRVTGVSIDIFNLVESVEIQSISYQYASVVTPTVSIMPISYTYDSENDLAKVDIKNAKDDTGYVWIGSSYIIFLDSEGLPVYWSDYDKLKAVPYVIDKDASVTINSEKLDFAGSVTKLKIILGFGVDAWNPAWNIQ
jgi:hypothetical protein